MQALRTCQNSKLQQHASPYPPQAGRRSNNQWDDAFSRYVHCRWQVSQIIDYNRLHLWTSIQHLFPPIYQIIHTWIHVRSISKAKRTHKCHHGQEHWVGAICQVPNPLPKVRRGPCLEPSVCSYRYYSNSTTSAALMILNYLVFFKRYLFLFLRSRRWMARLWLLLLTSLSNEQHAHFSKNLFNVNQIHSLHILTQVISDWWRWFVLWKSHSLYICVLSSFTALPSSRVTEFHEMIL